MSYTIYYQPKNKISGVRESSSKCETAAEALRGWDATERSDEKVRLEDSKGRDVCKRMLEVLARGEKEN